MLHLVEVSAPVTLTADQLKAAIQTINDEEWVASGLASARHFLHLAGTPDAPITLSPSRRFGALVDGVGDDEWGDIFFRADSFYFVTNKSLRGASRLSVGGIGPDSSLVAAGVEELRAVVKAGVLDSMDGRSTRHMRFDWAPVADSNGFEQLIDHLRQRGSEPAFTQASLDEGTTSAAAVLAEKSSRELLRELVPVRFARTHDILSKRGNKTKAVEETLAGLAAAGLTAAEHTLQCRKTSTPLTHFSDPSLLNQEPVASLRCASCSRPYSDELLVEGHGVTSQGVTLMQGSHWMTIVTTAALVSAGVPVESIRWGLEENGDEIDIVVEHLDQIWVFELKDREFGPGDAHPFNYRRTRYRASRAVVVTTETVARQAKQVFADAADGRRVRGSEVPAEPIYIEGLAQLEQSLEREFARATLEYTARRVRPVTFPVNLDLTKVLVQKFRPMITGPSRANR